MDKTGERSDIGVRDSKENRKMIDNTINDDKTIAAGGKGTILAGRYRILRQLGRDGMGSMMCDLKIV